MPFRAKKLWSYSAALRQVPHGCALHSAAVVGMTPRTFSDMRGELEPKWVAKHYLVPFVEGGTVFEEVYPDFDRTVRFAAGIGLRHHTLIGPLRLDFAFPINIE